MTTETVHERLAAIREMAAIPDDETAHALEDTLYKDVLVAIAHGAGDPAMLAATALLAGDIKFHRWYE